MLDTRTCFSHNLQQPLLRRRKPCFRFFPWTSPWAVISPHSLWTIHCSQPEQKTGNAKEEKENDSSSHCFCITRADDQRLALQIDRRAKWRLHTDWAWVSTHLSKAAIILLTLPSCESNPVYWQVAPRRESRKVPIKPRRRPKGMKLMASELPCLVSSHLYGTKAILFWGYKVSVKAQSQPRPASWVDNSAWHSDAWRADFQLGGGGDSSSEEEISDLPVKLNTMPINKPPAAPAAVPNTEIPPFVPLGTTCHTQAISVFMVRMIYTMG